MIKDQKISNITISGSFIETLFCINVDAGKPE